MLATESFFKLARLESCIPKRRQRKTSPGWTPPSESNLTVLPSRKKRKPPKILRTRNPPPPHWIAAVSAAEVFLAAKNAKFLKLRELCELRVRFLVLYAPPIRSPLRSLRSRPRGCTHGLPKLNSPQIPFPGFPPSGNGRRSRFSAGIP